MPLLLLVVLLPVVLLALMPLILIQRYRVGAARRMARPWVATLNLMLMTFSAICFLASLGQRGLERRGPVAAARLVRPRPLTLPATRASAT